MTPLLASAGGLAQPSGGLGRTYCGLSPSSSYCHRAIPSPCLSVKRWRNGKGGCLKKTSPTSTHLLLFQDTCWLCECTVNFPPLVGRCEDLGEYGLTEEVNGARNGLCTTQLQMLNLRFFLVSLPAQDEAYGSSGRQGHLHQRPTLTWDLLSRWPGKVSL